MAIEKIDRDFNAEIEVMVKELRNRKELLFFIWLCAIRSIPYLGYKRKFCYWEKEKIQDNLQLIFNALDVAAASIDDEANSVFFTDDITKIISLERGAIVFPIATVFYAVNAVNYVISVEATVYSATNACNSARYGGDHPPRFLDAELQEMIFNDIRAILSGDYNQLNNDTSIYESVWDNFQRDLTAIGCKYWADLYTDIFRNHFQFDDKAKEKLKQRISVPDEVRQQGAAAVANYLENIENQGLVYDQRETRLIILGSAGAGKTTLVKRLSGDMKYPAPRDSTHGVDTNVTLDLHGIKTHVWDFGGQVIYHASHRCFLSENCIYILVVNARTEDNRDINRIRYWLDTMRVYSDGKAKVFIVINESDGRDLDVEDYDSLKEDEYGELIQEIFSFNIGDDMDSVNKFKEMLATNIEINGYQAFGENDNRAIKQIKALFDKNTQVMKADELERILIENDILKSKDQKRAKELFNTLGVALSYDFMDSCVLDPYWISHGVYKVIDYLQQEKSKFVKRSDLDAVFAKERSTYPKDKYGYILQLMEHYKIGFRNKDGIHGLIIPCAASQLKPKSLNVKADSDSIMTWVERDDLQEFPADFFYKFICANEVDIKKNGEQWSMWQTGMVLTEKHASALVELKENRRIEIIVWGPQKEEYRKKLESLIDSQLKEYRFVAHREEREKGGKLFNFISLAFEAAAKGGLKAGIEAGLAAFASGGITL